MKIRLNMTHIPRIMEALEGIESALHAEKEDLEKARKERQGELEKYNSLPFYVRIFKKKPMEASLDPRFANNHGWWATEYVHYNTIETIKKQRAKLLTMLEALSDGEEITVTETEYNLLRSEREKWVQLLQITSPTIQ